MLSQVQRFKVIRGQIAAPVPISSSRQNVPIVPTVHRGDYYDVIDQRFLGDENFAEKLKVKRRRRSGDATA